MPAVERACLDLSPRSTHREQESYNKHVMKKRIPEFRSEDRDRSFWAKRGSTEYIDWSHVKRRKLPELKPSLRTISLRLPILFP